MTLPRFTVHPADSYIIRGKSAGMECEAEGADKAYFVCNGEAMSSSAASKAWLPDGYSRIFRLYVFGPAGF